MSTLEEVRNAVEAGKTKLVPELIQGALDAGHSAQDILQAMIDSMMVVGNKFSAGEIFVPEMLIAAKAMARGVDVLKPLLTGKSGVSLGKCVIGTVAGDLHDIGKNLVSMMLESAGFEIIDLGVDVPAARFVEAVKNNDNVTLVACSALLTTTLPAMRETVQTLKSSGLGGFKVMVGGAQVSPDFAAAIGADGFAPDAGLAAEKAVELVKTLN